MKVRNLYRLDEIFLEFSRCWASLKIRLKGEFEGTAAIENDAKAKEALKYSMDCPMYYFSPPEELADSLITLRNAVFERYSDKECPFIDCIDEIISNIEDELMTLDSDARRVFLTNAIRFAPIELCASVCFNLSDAGWKKMRSLFPDESIFWDCDELFASIEDYIGSLRTLVLDYNLSDKIIVREGLMDILLTYIESSYFNTDDDLPDMNIIKTGGGPDGEPIKYGGFKYSSSSEYHHTLPRSVRRAMAEILLDKSGYCKNIDRTKKAAIIEATTGGNTDTKPQHTAAYKKPTATAIKAAKSYLRSKGIEIPG